eukprot:331818_1
MEIRPCRNSNIERVPNSPTPNMDNKSWGNAQHLTPFMLYFFENKHHLKHLEPAEQVKESSGQWRQLPEQRAKEYCEMAITYSNAANRKEGEEDITGSASSKSASNPPEVPTATTSPTSHSKITPKSSPS